MQAMEPNQTASRTTGGRDRLNSRIVAVGAALGLTFAGIGIAGAQTGSTMTPESPPPSASAEDPGHRKGPGRHDHRACGRHRGGVKAALSVAAAAVGISEEELRTALRSGQSLAEVARSREVPVKKVVDALVADARKRLEAKVAAGELTQAQADERAYRLEERITAMVSRSRPARPGSEGRPRARSTSAAAGPSR